MTFPFDYSGLKALVLATLLPPAPMLLLAAWGGWRLKRAKRGGGWMLGVALALTWMSATEVAGEWLSRAAGQPLFLSPPQVVALRPQKDGAVLVLGGGVNRYVPEYGGGMPNDITAERLAYGVWLARVSGWPLGFSGGIGWAAHDLRQSEASIVARVAAQHYGLPLRWAEGKSRDTRENAANTLPMLAQAGVKQVLLVTSEEHMARSLRAFEAQAAPLGIRVMPAPVGLRLRRGFNFADWCPSGDGFRRVRYVVYETLAWWTGR